MLAGNMSGHVRELGCSTICAPGRSTRPCMVPRTAAGAQHSRPHLRFWMSSPSDSCAHLQGMIGGKHGELRFEPANRPQGCCRPGCGSMNVTTCSLTCPPAAPARQRGLQRGAIWLACSGGSRVPATGMVALSRRTGRDGPHRPVQPRCRKMAPQSMHPSRSLVSWRAVAGEASSWPSSSSSSSSPPCLACCTLPPGPNTSSSAALI
jgi:hypothetical protein